MSETIGRWWQRIQRLLGFLRNYDWREALTTYVALWKLRRLPIPSNAVLMIEPNRFHAEILPGYAWYLKTLGYDAYLLLRRENALSGIFDRMHPNAAPRLFVMHPRGMRRILGRTYARGFRYVLITSSYWAEPYGYWGPIQKYFATISNRPGGCGVVAHSMPQMLPHIDEGLVRQEDLLLLTEEQSGKSPAAMVNPHYFGSVKIKRQPGRRRVFLSVGSLLSANRGVESLFRAVRQLEIEGGLDFEVRIVGRAMATRGAFPEAPGTVRFLGRLTYPRLFDELESADFLLNLLDPGNQSHRRYLSGETTGSRQLSLGFGKIPIINDEFAAAYGFSEECAITYPGAQLESAMRRACLLPDDCFDKRVRSLEMLAAQVAERSMANLAARIEATQG